MSKLTRALHRKAEADVIYKRACRLARDAEDAETKAREAVVRAKREVFAQEQRIINKRAEVIDPVLAASGYQMGDPV